MKDKILFKAVVGSHAYGTATPTSDEDIKGVYMQDVDELISFGYKEQIDVNKDEVYYEVQRFLQLLQSANPTLLEMLYMPDDCIISTSPQFELIKKHRDMFLTKKCLSSFGGYAIAQIKKARGLDKKMNWEGKRITRLTPIDFIYAYYDGKAIPLKEWLELVDRKQEYCGLAAVNHFGNCYNLYYDYAASFGAESPFGFKGIQVDDSNTIRLSSIPKNLHHAVLVHYNKDAYSIHCKEFREYTAWLENRNTQRYVDVAGHNQQIDGKNLLHCRRLLDMAMEIATDGVISVKRPNFEYLLSIRRGEVDLETIISEAEKDIAKLDELFANSNLPDDCDKEQINKLLLEVRYLK